MSDRRDLWLHALTESSEDQEIRSTCGTTCVKCTTTSADVIAR